MATAGACASGVNVDEAVTEASVGDVDYYEVASNILSEFLEVAFHHILYMRGVYSATLFERRQKYGIPVHMSVHPELNQYIRDVLNGMKTTLDRGQVEKVVLAIRNKEHQVVEQFVFHLQGLNEKALREDGPLLELERDLRSVLLKISTSDASLKPIPSECTFVIHVHVTHLGAPGMECQDTITGFPWVKADGQQLLESPPTRTIPLKAVSSSLIKMQLYVHEKTDKLS